MTNTDDVLRTITELETELGPTLTAYTIGSRNRHLAAKLQNNQLQLTNEQALRAGVLYALFHRVAAEEGGGFDVARAWLIGSSVPAPQGATDASGGMISPSQAIRDGNFAGALASAHGLLHDTYL